MQRLRALLLITVDDLNDWTSYLGGHPQSKTPNIDHLAAAIPAASTEIKPTSGEAKKGEGKAKKKKTDE